MQALVTPAMQHLGHLRSEIKQQPHLLGLVMQQSCVRRDDNAREISVKSSVSLLALPYDKDYPASEGDRGRSWAYMEAVGSQA